MGAGIGMIGTRLREISSQGRRGHDYENKRNKFMVGLLALWLMISMVEVTTGTEMGITGLCMTGQFCVVSH